MQYSNPMFNGVKLPLKLRNPLVYTGLLSPILFEKPGIRHRIRFFQKFLDPFLAEITHVHVGSHGKLIPRLGMNGGKMRVRFLTVVASVALVMVFSAISASAQGVSKQARFKVPFNFNVGKKHLPAGEYTVISESEFIRLRSKDGKSTSIALPSHRIGATRRTNEVALAFSFDGDQYQLSRVWLPDGIGRGLKLRRSNDTRVATNLKTVEVLATTTR